MNTTNHYPSNPSIVLIPLAAGNQALAYGWDDFRRMHTYERKLAPNRKLPVPCLGFERRIASQTFGSILREPGGLSLPTAGHGF